VTSADSVASSRGVLAVDAPDTAPHRRGDRQHVFGLEHRSRLFLVLENVVEGGAGPFSIGRGASPAPQKTRRRRRCRRGRRWPRSQRPAIRQGPRQGLTGDSPNDRRLPGPTPGLARRGGLAGAPSASARSSGLSTRPRQATRSPCSCRSLIACGCGVMTRDCLAQFQPMRRPSHPTTAATESCWRHVSCFFSFNFYTGHARPSKRHRAGGPGGAAWTAFRGGNLRRDRGAGHRDGR
jgi:hypothetical protein